MHDQFVFISKKVFTEQECENIVGIGESLVLDQGTIYTEKEDKTIVDINFRDVYSANIKHTDKHYWVYRKILSCVLTANVKYQYEITSRLSEGNVHL